MDIMTTRQSICHPPSLFALTLPSLSLFLVKLTRSLTTAPIYVYYTHTLYDTKNMTDQNLEDERLETVVLQLNQLITIEISIIFSIKQTTENEATKKTFGVEKGVYKGGVVVVV